MMRRFPDFLLSLMGLAVFTWAYLDPKFRDAEGILKGSFCLPLSAGAALQVLAWSMDTAWKRFGLWFALGLSGQAIALQMIDAGRLIHYQHYKPPGELSPLLVILFAVQTCAVATGLKPYWRSIREWSRRHFRAWQLLAVGLVFVLSSAAPSREIGFYVAELFFAALVQAVNCANVVLMVLALPPSSIASLKHLFERWLGEGAIPAANRQVTGFYKRHHIDIIALSTAVWVTVLAVLLSVFSYELHPHVADEVGYLYHARYFAAGMFAMPMPPTPNAFNLDLMYYDVDRWYSPVPPGWPAVLAAGVFLGVPWLVNPLLAGFNILLTYSFLGELYDRRSARMAVSLLCVSPWYVFMAMNFMTHTFTLTCTLAAAVAVAQARRKGKAMWGWIGGIATGMVSLIRPLDGIIVAGLLGLWGLGIGAPRLSRPSLAGLVLGSMAIGAVVLPYNSVLTGQATVHPLMAYFDKYYGPKSNALGFGPERGVGWAVDPYPGHSPLDALVNANLNIFSINTELFGWSTGSVVLMALLLFSGAMRRSDYLMLAVIVAVLGVYSLYWFSGGPDFGARYWYLVILPCVALTVSGIRFLEKSLQRTAAHATGNGTRVVAAVLLLCVLTLVNYFPWRAIDKYFHYLRMRPDIRYLAKEYGFGRSLVLIRGERHPDYASAAVYNPLDLRADAPIYAWDRDPQLRAQIFSAYGDRPVWIVDGPSVTGDGYKVIAGPLSSEALSQGSAQK